MTQISSYSLHIQGGLPTHPFSDCLVSYFPVIFFLTPNHLAKPLAIAHELGQTLIFGHLSFRQNEQSGTLLSWEAAFISALQRCSGKELWCCSFPLLSGACKLCRTIYIPSLPQATVHVMFLVRLRHRLGERRWNSSTGNLDNWATSSHKLECAFMAAWSFR